MAWYTVPGKTCVAAYDAIGAASLADSYVNEANPGTYNAAPGVAPTWAYGTGWTFNGSTQWLDTGVTPDNNETWSIFIRYSGYSAPVNYSGLCRCFTSASSQFGVLLGATQTLYENGKRLTKNGTAASAVVGVAGLTAYKDAVSQGAISSGASGALLPLPIGASNDSTVIKWFLAASIQAVAIYSDTLTSDEVSDLTDAMNALPTAAGNPVAIIQQQHWRSVWAGGVPVG